MAGVKVTLPAKPVTEMTVIVQVFPVVAPRVTVIGEPPMVNPGGGAGMTVTEFDPEELLNRRAPAASGA
jgi:hypothetical protein